MRDAQGRPVLKRTEIIDSDEYEAEFADGRVKMRPLGKKSL